MEMRNTTTRNLIIGIHCKTLPPTHHVCFLTLIFLFFKTLSILPHSYLHVLLTPSFPFYYHYCHLPSKFSFFFLFLCLPFSHPSFSSPHSCISHIIIFFFIFLLPLILHVFPLFLTSSLNSLFILPSRLFVLLILFLTSLNSSFSTLFYSLLPLFQYLLSSHPSPFPPFLPLIIPHSFLSVLHPSSLAVTICQEPGRWNDIETHIFTRDNPMASWFQ
jgi:hypothetical protein